jgi:hypothetical protein
MLPKTRTIPCLQLQSQGQCTLHALQLAPSVSVVAQETRRLVLVLLSAGRCLGRQLTTADAAAVGLTPGMLPPVSLRWLILHDRLLSHEGRLLLWQTA